MMKLLRRSAILACSLVALVACEGDDPVPPQPCFNCGPDFGTTAGLVIQNKTDHSVSFTMRDTSTAIQIDRKVLDGSIAVPIGPAIDAVQRSFPLSPEATTAFTAPVQVLSGTSILPQTGGAFSIGGGPFLFAVGRGLLVVRTRDGVDVVEVADPRAVTVLPVEPDVPKCADTAFGAKLPESPSRILTGDSMSVTAVSVDTNGCRVFELETGSSAVDYIVCLPDAAYPFAATDSITMSPVTPTGVRFESASGVVLELLPTRFLTREPQSPSGIPMVFAEDATCAKVSSTCADVEVPAKVLFSFDGKTRQTLAVGESIVDPRNAQRTVVVVGARTRPVLVPGCTAADSSGVSATAEVVLASIERPAP